MNVLYHSLKKNPQNSLLSLLKKRVTETTRYLAVGFSLSCQAFLCFSLSLEIKSRSVVSLFTFLWILRCNFQEGNGEERRLKGEGGSPINGLKSAQASSYTVKKILQRGLSRKRRKGQRRVPDAPAPGREVALQSSGHWAHKLWETSLSSDCISGINNKQTNELCFGNDSPPVAEYSGLSEAHPNDFINKAEATKSGVFFFRLSGSGGSWCFLCIKMPVSV